MRPINDFNNVSHLYSILLKNNELNFKLQMNGWKDKQMNEQTNGQMDG